VRLLLCKVCTSIDEIPDYSGKDEVDPLVEAVLLKHTEKDPMGHGSATLTHTPFILRKVNEWEWATEREAIIVKLNEEAKTTGFDGWAYESHNQYLEDAMKCYRQHHRPVDSCSDYWSDSKRIGRPTPEGRAVVKDQYKLGEGDPHLCQWCPYHSQVTTERRFREGLYKDP
jgi:hypothetical protein